MFHHVAAGVTFTLVVASAPWADRDSHTTVIDSAGAIYLIGGSGGDDTFYHDVWVSTDTGADRTQGVLEGDLGYVFMCLCVFQRARAHG
jgi:hypothetical protein